MESVSFALVLGAPGLWPQGHQLEQDFGVKHAMVQCVIFVPS